LVHVECDGFSFVRDCVGERVDACYFDALFGCEFAAAAVIASFVHVGAREFGPVDVAEVEDAVVAVFC